MFALAVVYALMCVSLEYLYTASRQSVRCAKEICGCMDFIHKVSVHGLFVGLMSTNVRILLAETEANKKYLSFSVAMID